MSKKASDEKWNKLIFHSGKLREMAEAAIYRYLKHHVEPDEVVTETLQYAYDNGHQWEHIPEHELIYYLRKIANYHILNKARQFQVARKHINENLENSPAAEKEISFERTSPARKAHKTEKCNAVGQILNRLESEGQREILRLVWIEGMKVKDAADMMGRSAKATSNLLQRAMESCRAIARRQSFVGFNLSGETR